MSNLISKGYYVPGINNVSVRLYPQVLGIQKIHEHNLCNALRDFGLIIKSDSRRFLVDFRYDLLKFAHLMRSSEICMIAHGYSILRLDDHTWWDSFLKISSNVSVTHGHWIQNLFDMDGKEIASFLYSLTKIYSTKNYLISKLIEESKSWINLSNPITLSLMVKASSYFEAGPQIMRMLNKRIQEIKDQMKIVDIVFFITCNVESRTHDIAFFRDMCIRIIELEDQIELHHLRAIAASLSMGGFKSHIMFNVLSIKLSQLHKRMELKEGDVISLVLAYTTQKFIVHNDLCIDPSVYKNFIQTNPTKSKDIFKFPLPEFGEVMAVEMVRNIETITANGMPILFRGISILDIPVPKEFLEYLADKTARYLDNDVYVGIKLSNLIVTFAKFVRDNPKIWKAVHGTLSRQKDLKISPDMLSKMINTILSMGRDKVSQSEELSAVYEILLEKCPQYMSQMGERSILSLNRQFSVGKKVDLLTSDEYLQALLNTINRFKISDLIKILKSYVPYEEKIRANPSDKFREFLAEVQNTLGREDIAPSQAEEIKQILQIFRLPQKK